MACFNWVRDGEPHTLIFTPPARLSDLMARLGAPPDMPCGGSGRCLKCRVEAAGALSPRTEKEAALPPQERLACLTQALGDVTVTTRGKKGEVILTDNEMPDFARDGGLNGLGLAVDIGTTTVAGYLYDLASGSRLAVDARANPQGAFGADVITRISKSLAGEGAALRDAIGGCVLDLARSLTAHAGYDLSALRRAVLTGNTAMLYLLTGKSPASIAAAPFISETLFGETADLQNAGLPIEAYLPRCMAAYVGADITCAMLAAGLCADGRAAGTAARLMVDIGTNGEMILSANGVLIGCSTAAGPAFEGAGIHQGMRAAPGAIDRVALTDGRIALHTVGDAPAAGLCGSGLVDALAALLEAGVVDETGRMEKGGHALAEYIVPFENQPAFRFPNTDVLLTQADVRAAQLAKAAICAGLLTLIEDAGLQPADIRSLSIAGGFGNCVNALSAERVGLIPPGFARKALRIGNAAGAGACMLLLSEKLRAESSEAARNCRVIELSESPFFMEEYVNQMCFE